MLLAFLAYAPSWLLGYLVVDAIWHAVGLRASLLKLFISLGIGLGVASLLIFAWLLAARRLEGFEWLLAAAILVGLIGKWLRLRRRPPHFVRPVRNAGPAWLAAALFLGFAVTLVLSYGSFRTYSLTHPHGDRDAQAIWNLHARVIYRNVASWPEVFSSEFDVRFHADYPLLTPLNVVMGWDSLRSETTRVPIVLAGLFAFGMIGVLFSGLLNLKSLGQASLASMVLMGTPYFLLLSTFQTADVPLSYFVLSSIVLWMLYAARQEAGLLVLAGLAAGLSAWTKNEGILFVLASLVGCAVYGVVRHQAWKTLSRFALGLLAPAIVIVYYKVTLAPSNDLFMGVNAGELLGKIASLPRYETILAELGKSLLTIGNWPYSILAVLALFAVIVGPSRNRAQGRAALTCAIILTVQLAGYLFIYVITPLPLEFHLQYSLDRLLFQLFPASLFLAFWAISTLEELLPYRIKLAARPSEQYASDH